MRQRTRPHAPLTSEIQLERTRKQVNALNRQRSKTMERRVAKKLRGRRVPMSGAAARYKGDVEIPFVSYPGNYIIECKLSAQQEALRQFIRLDFKWFPKIHDEAKSMNAKFGVVIINYLHSTNDYVFIRLDIARLLIQRSNYGQEIQYLLDNALVVDMRYDPKGKPKSSMKLFKHHLERDTLDYHGMRGLRAILPDAEYLIVELNTFDTIMLNV